MKNLKIVSVVSSIFASVLMVALFAIFSVSGGQVNAQTAVTTPVPVPTTDTTAKVTASRLELTYNYPQSESLLKASFTVAVQGGSKGIYIYRIGGGYGFYDQKGVISQANSQGDLGLTPTTFASSSIDAWGQTLYFIPAGKTISFTGIRTIDPKQMFAGTYYGHLISLWANSLPGNNRDDINSSFNLELKDNNKTWTKTIIGEKGPYIKSVSGPVKPGEIVTVTGDRLANVTLYIDGSTTATSIFRNRDNKVVYFMAPKLASGQHYVTLSNKTVGMSNKGLFQINDGTVKSYPVAEVTPGLLALTLNPAGNKEVLLSAPFNVTVTAGSDSVQFDESSFSALYTRQTGGSQQGVTTVVKSIDNKTPVYPFVLKSGQKATFSVLASANPLTMFAGFYSMSLSAINVVNLTTNSRDGFAFPTNKTNPVIIIGELSPYIVSVTTPIKVGETMTVVGQRVGNSSVYIDSLKIDSTRIASSAGSLSFPLPTLTTGQHYMQLQDATTGASNRVYFQVTEGTKDLSTNIRITSVERRADLPYVFDMVFCVDGNQSVYEQTGRKFFPEGYRIVNSKGVAYEYNSVSASQGNDGLEDLKNGACKDLAFLIQPQHQAIFDSVKKVTFIGDPLNAIKETNENDNSMTYTVPVTQSGSASVSISSATPQAGTVIANSGPNNDAIDKLTLLIFEVKPNVNSILETLAVKFSTLSNLETAYLYDGSTLIDSATITNGVATFSQTDVAIAESMIKQFIIKVDVRNVNTASVNVSASVNSSDVVMTDMKQNKINFSGTAQGSNITISPDVALPVFTLVGTPTVDKVTSSNSQTGTSTSVIRYAYNIRVEAAGGDVTMGLMNSQAPAFQVAPNYVQLYKNGTPVDSSTYDLKVQYGSPDSGVIMDNVNHTFTIQEGNSPTVQVYYVLTITGAASSNAYAIRLNSIGWGSATQANQVTTTTGADWKTSAVVAVQKALISAPILGTASVWDAIKVAMGL